MRGGRTDTEDGYKDFIHAYARSLLISADGEEFFIFPGGARLPALKVDELYEMWLKMGKPQ